jgi:hypothetical protein
MITSLNKASKALLQSQLVRYSFLANEFFGKEINEVIDSFFNYEKPTAATTLEVDFSTPETSPKANHSL